MQKNSKWKHFREYLLTRSAVFNMIVILIMIRNYFYIDSISKFSIVMITTMVILRTIDIMFLQARIMYWEKQ